MNQKNSIGELPQPDKSKTKVAMDIRKYFELDDNEDMA